MGNYSPPHRERPTGLHELKHGLVPSAISGIGQNHPTAIHECNPWVWGFALSHEPLDSCTLVRRLSAFYPGPERNRSTSIGGVLSANGWKGKANLELKQGTENQGIGGRQGGEGNGV
jgi:hypothetical protein